MKVNGNMCSPDNQHTTTTTTTTTPTDTLFPINHDSLTITKKTISDSQANKQMPLFEVVEEPCIKKHYSLLGPSAHTATAIAQKQGKRMLKSQQNCKLHDKTKYK